MKVIIANDHSSVEFKKNIILWLQKHDYTVLNLGADDEQSVDYPDMANKACSLYLESPETYTFIILLCGTGIGISIAANRHKDIRCALVHDSMTAALAKEHNNANAIALGARISYNEPIEKILEAYTQAQFLGGRHLDRIKKLEI